MKIIYLHSMELWREEICFSLREDVCPASTQGCRKEGSRDSGCYPYILLGEADYTLVCFATLDLEGLLATQSVGREL